VCVQVLEPADLRTRLDAELERASDVCSRTAELQMIATERAAASERLRERIRRERAGGAEHPIGHRDTPRAPPPA
jgi:hypothetical protein